MAINEFINADKNKAIKKLSKYIKKNKSDYVAKYNLGYMLDQISDTDNAIKYYLEVSKNKIDHWQSRLNLSIIYIKLENFTSALIFINEVLKIYKDYQPALRDKAFCLYNLRDQENQIEAFKLIKLSIKLNPNDYIAINTLGLIHLKLEEYKKAKEIFEKAISINKLYAPSFSNLGRCYELLNLPNKSIEFFLKAKEIDPKSHIILNNIAGYYVNSGEYQEGLNNYFEALKIRPKDLMIASNISKNFFYLENYTESEKWILKCLVKDKNNPDFKKTYGIMLFKKNNYEKAWSYYESRLHVSNFGIKNKHAKNIDSFLWNGTIFEKNKKILIIKEQGIGDEIVYASMYNDLLKDFSNVKIETDPKLNKIFSNNFKNYGKDIFFDYGYYSSNKKTLSMFDVVMYAGSLGKLYRNNIAAFPKKKYLKIYSSKNKELQLIKKQIGNNFKIGISWKSFRKKITTAQAKSLELINLKSLFELKKLSFFNLQYGEVNEEIEKFNSIENNNLIKLKSIDLYNDLESLGALLKKLDLFITVSNTTAHLAGALGVETWLIKGKNHAAFHYWNQESNKTPWYENVKIYDGNLSWNQAIEKIKYDLKIKFNLHQ